MHYTGRVIKTERPPHSDGGPSLRFLSAGVTQRPSFHRPFLLYIRCLFQDPSSFFPASPRFPREPSGKNIRSAFMVIWSFKVIYDPLLSSMIFRYLVILLFMIILDTYAFLIFTRSWSFRRSSQSARRPSPEPSYFRRRLPVSWQIYEGRMRTSLPGNPLFSSRRLQLPQQPA